MKEMTTTNMTAAIAHHQWLTKSARGREHWVGSGNCALKDAKKTDELRHHKGCQYDHHEDRHDGHDGGVHHRRRHLRASLDIAIKIISQLVKNRVEVSRQLCRSRMPM